MPQIICPNCGGSGAVQAENDAHPRTTFTVDCPKCHGSGKIIVRDD